MFCISHFMSFPRLEEGVELQLQSSAFAFFDEDLLSRRFGRFCEVGMSFAIVMSMLAISLEENFGFSPKEVGYTMTGAAIVHAQSRENGTKERLSYNYIHGCVYNQCQLYY